MAPIWAASRAAHADATAIAEPLDCDILIVGAGPAGAALALALSGRFRVVMAGRQATGPRIGETLPGAARALLRDLGHLAAFEAELHPPCLGRMSAWGGDAIERFDAFRDPHGPGWRLDRGRFDAGLIGAAIARGCRFVPCGPLEEAERRGAGWRLRFAGGVEVGSRFVVDATGRRAALARRLGALQTRLDTLVSVFARLSRPEASELDGFSTVLADEDGWWYRAALPSGDCLVAFHTDRDLAASRQTRLSGSGALATGRVAAWSGRLTEFAGSGWAAVGDAACSFDPLSSQGLFNALHGAVALSRAIEAGWDARSYAAALERVWDRFLQHRRAYYGAERRWTAAPFWRRRHDGQA